MKRFDFIKRIATASVVGFPLLPALSGCYKTEDDPVPGTTPPKDADCLANGTNSSISVNHGHTMTVSKDDVQSGVEKSYSIQGSSSHPHTVIISSSKFDDLKDNNSVEVVSTNDSGHSHTITVSCA